MTGYELATLAISAVQAVASLGAVTVILAGIRQMRHTGDLREKCEDARHAESMEALRALIRGMEHQGARSNAKGSRSNAKGSRSNGRGRHSNAKGPHSKPH